MDNTLQKTRDTLTRRVITKFGKSENNKAESEFWAHI